MVKGWKEKKLGDIAEIRMCKRIFTEQTALNGEIPFFKIGTLGKEPDAYISRVLYSNYRNKYSFPEKGDILLSTAGTLGKTVVYDGKPSYFQDSNIVWLEIDEDQICNEYLYHCYQVMIWASPEGSTISRLYNGLIRNTNIILPPLPEQRAIAAVLSDMDGYIAALEKLLTKKRDIKKGAMQELLTGKRRLPGFHWEWVEKTLFELVPNLRMGQSPDSRFYNTELQGLPLIQGNADIENRKTIVRFYTLQITRCAHAGDIILTVRAPVGNVAKATFDCCLGRGVCGFSYPNEYLYQRLVYFEPFWGSLSTGSTFDSISGDKLKEVVIGLPENENEQTAIAAILSDMDAEIDALTAKLNKAKLIKQGMMRELLTGRIRLVAEETEAAPVAKPTAKVIELSKREPQTAAAQASGHNKAIEDAVILAVVADLYATERFPLTPFYAQEFPYLLHRYIEGVAQGYHKLAAGPYNAELKYRTALPIAKKNRYVVTQKSQYKGKSYEAMLAGDNIEQAKDYFAQWHGNEPLKWLEQFRYIKNRREELELLATVDMAMVELREAGAPISVQAVKAIIQASEEWKEKLKREIFSDDNIARAIKWSNNLFGTEVKMP